MGAYSGKILTAYISPTGVRIAEGENRGGNPNISRFFMVPAVEEYFTEIPGSAGLYEITNMAGLVDAIIEECANQRTSSKRVMISTNCLGITTQVFSEASKTSDFKSMLSGDIGGKKDGSGKKREKAAVGMMQCKVSWGDMVLDGKALRQITTTTGDKYILQSLAKEFFQRGYTIVSVSDAVGTLMNFRQAEEATFDHKGKVIFDFDTSFSVINMVKDLPVAINPISYMDAFELNERILAMVQDAAEQVGRSP